jgi:hypothetical protein
MTLARGGITSKSEGVRAVKLSMVVNRTDRAVAYPYMSCRQLEPYYGSQDAHMLGLSKANPQVPRR